MKIITTAKEFELYFRHILLEVFPVEFLDSVSEEPFYLDVSSENDTVRASISFKSAVHTDVQLLNDHHSKSIAHTCAIGRAVIKLACEFGFTSPPYGVLTGVRPIKVAAEIYPTDFEVFANELYSKYLVSENKSRLLYSSLKYDTIVRKNHKENDVSLYFSIPFCPSRCNYCSFVS